MIKYLNMIYIYIYIYINFLSYKTYISRILKFASTIYTQLITIEAIKKKTRLNTDFS